MEKTKYTKPKLDRIEQKCLEIKTYNELTGDNLSYGQYVMYQKMGRLKPVPVTGKFNTAPQEQKKPIPVKAKLNTFKKKYNG